MLSSALESWFLILVIVIIIYSFDNIIGKMSVNNRKLYLSCLFFAILLLSLINSAFVEIRHFDRYSHLNISVYTFSFWLVRSYLFGARVFIIITRKDSCETPEISHDEKLNLFITYFFSASLCLPLTHTSVDNGGSKKLYKFYYYRVYHIQIFRFYSLMPECVCLSVCLRT